MAKKNSIDHAKHNRKVCNFLNQREQYSDWVITVAFYSAMKYIEHKIFPMDILVAGKASKVQDFDQFYTSEYTLKGKDINKHSALVSLVDEQLPNIAPSYRWLKSTAYTARYHNYEYDRATAQRAKVYLEKVVNECT